MPLLVHFTLAAIASCRVISRIVLLSYERVEERFVIQITQEVHGPGSTRAAGRSALVPAHERVRIPHLERGSFGHIMQSED